MTITRPLTTSEAARVLGLSEAQTRRLGDAGEIPTLRTARGLRVYDRDAVERLRAKRAQLQERSGH